MTIEVKPTLRGTATGAFVLAALVALVGIATDVAGVTRIAFCLIQLSCLALLATATSGRTRPTWTSASFILAMAWGALFLIPSVAYTADPSLLDIDGLTAALAAITASTVGLTAGYLLSADRSPFPPTPDEPRVRLTTSRVRPGAAVAVYAFGLAALGVVVMKAGGPAAYLSNLDKTLGLTAGLFYVLAMSLAMRWVPMAIIAQRWAAGRPVGFVTWAALAVGLGLLTLTGSRLFLVVGLLELGLLAALLKFTIPTARVVAVGLIVGIVITFGIGATKRYQTAVSTGTIGQLTFTEYMTQRAPREVVPAYVNNYVDSLRVTALAMDTVPGKAGYETYRPALELLLKPVPSSFRPALDRDDAIKASLYPEGTDGAYAISLITTGWLAGGISVMVLIAVGIGMIVRSLDRRLLARGPMAPWKLLLLVMAIVSLPSALRAGIPNGVALSLTDIIGSGLVAWLVLASAPAAPTRTDSEPQKEAQVTA